MDKDQFLAELQRARTEWEAAVAAFPLDQFEAPLERLGGWSLKDVIAHISWHENEMNEVIKTRSLAGSDWWNLPLDERNQMIYLHNRSRTLAEVRGEAERVYAELLERFEGLSEHEINDPSWIADLVETIGEVPPWEIFAENTYEHYDDHCRDLVSGAGT